MKSLSIIGSHVALGLRVSRAGFGVKTETNFFIDNLLVRIHSLSRPPQSPWSFSDEEAVCCRDALA